MARKEDGRLLRGYGSFVDDVRYHDMAYVHFVRSPYAHARIRSIDVNRAEELPDVVCTMTGEEVAGLVNSFFEIAPEPGGNIRDYPLAVGKTRFVGEPVAAVVARSRDVARDGADLVRVSTSPSPPLWTPRRPSILGRPWSTKRSGQTSCGTGSTTTVT